MKIAIAKSVEVKDAQLTITLFLDKKTTKMVLGYTCPHCDGYGCSSHGNHNNNNCSRGDVSQVIDPSNLDETLDAATAITIKCLIQNLYLQVIGD